MNICQNSLNLYVLHHKNIYLYSVSYFTIYLKLFILRFSMLYNIIYWNNFRLYSIICNFIAYCFLRPYNVIIHVNKVNSFHHKKFPHVFMHSQCAKQIKPNCNHEDKVSINFHFNNIFIFERIHRIPFSACLTKFEWSNTQPV